MSNAKWIVDATHSSVDFTIRHMMISKVKGTFHTFDADIEANPSDLTTANIAFSVDLSSIDTRNADRDNHLRTGDFFDTENHPKLTFKSAQISKTDDDEYAITGEVTLHGVTRTETFSATFEGEGKDPWGNVKAGFSAKGSLNRSDYGLTYNAALETGGVLIADEVKISLEIQASQQA
ncbi:polyisoprenoid-binding protein [Paenibacillus baekrokdamisoli]|uniref:Polyisoprenoid-binding protein n=1 Tax=Paenibacillus baekrokdamisoli TaxID=1712516 RepID=A0A3G9JLH9_9BACL|nr:YceI family protein [Paenibacillus baekrokdamisoli]MBB3068932.1 polyisoprenoid-binding protein YceI [Paenibacillus baekrokdamisoli]BBH23754.1 polyisoprenoid-binding protein [Paenibacillus baekrokdamisoli]